MRTLMQYKVVRAKTKIKDKCSHYDKEVTRPADIIPMIRELLCQESQEVFIAFFFDTRLRIKGYSEIGRGGIDQCPVDMRVLFRNALLAGAASIMIAHNHPSGISEPSAQDNNLTMLAVDAGKIIGMCVIDHIIIGDIDSKEIYSYAEHKEI